MAPDRKEIDVCIRNAEWLYSCKRSFWTGVAVSRKRDS